MIYHISQAIRYKSSFSIAKFDLESRAISLSSLSSKLDKALDVDVMKVHDGLRTVHSAYDTYKCDLPTLVSECDVFDVTVDPKLR